MVVQTEITLPPRHRGCHLITREIIEALGPLPSSGLLNIFVRHTSCGLTINENADPDVRTDLSRILDNIVPDGQRYLSHTSEGPDDMSAHAKSSLTDVSLTIPIVGGKLGLGTWQGIYLCEFRDYGGARKIILTIYY